MSARRAIRVLTLDDMPAAARVHRISFDARLPWLAGLHTPEEDQAFWSRQLFGRCEIHGCEEDGLLQGVIAVGDGWIEQLYVLPQAQGQGVGVELLNVAKAEQAELLLWTFQRNGPPRRFYERNGFRPVRETDGAGNEEGEPDVLYQWRAGS